MRMGLADSHGKYAWDVIQLMGGLHQAEVEADEYGAAGAPERRRQARLRCLLPQRELLPRSAPIFLNKLSTIHTATASRPASGIRTATIFLPAPLGPFRGQRCLCEDVFSVVQAEARRPGQHIERLMTTMPRLNCSAFASPHDFKRKAALRCRHPHICHRPLSLPCSCSPIECLRLGRRVGDRQSCKLVV